MIDEDKVKMAIFQLREARKAVQECGAFAECWVVKDIENGIEALQMELGVI